MVRLKIIGTQWKIVEKLKQFRPKNGNNWMITYCSPTYGGWDLIIDIDAKNWQISKITAWLIVECLKEFGIKSISIKFSGNKGFHPYVQKLRKLHHRQLHTENK